MVYSTLWQLNYKIKKYNVLCNISIVQQLYSCSEIYILTLN